ncbi:MAG: lipid A export permease/ATP-binding protein MsbA [Burkholderiaceae bacterium]
MGTLLQRLKRVLPYADGTGKAAWGVLAATLVGAATEPAIPWLMKLLLDHGFQAGGVQLWLVPVALMGLFAVRGGAMFTAQYAMSWASNLVMLNLRRALFATLQTAPVSLFSRTSASSLSNTVVYEIQAGMQLLVGALFSVLRDSLTLLALLGYLLWTNWKLTLIVLLVFPGVAWIMKAFSRRMYRITVASQKATDELAYVVEENALAHRMVRLHHVQAAQQSRFEALSKVLRRLSIKSTAASAATTPLTQLLAAAALSAVICIALWQSAGGQITVGGFAAFVTAMLMLVAPIRHLSDAASPITRGLAAIERGLDLIERTPPEHGGTHDPGRARGHIHFEQVTVRYEQAVVDALDGLTLEIAPGQVVALVGGSGSGKTTAANLLPRFVTPTAGRVLLDGVDIAQWQLDALRRQFAYVSQDVVMFNDSIAGNVALGEAIDRERVRRALEAANLWDFVCSLPQGIDSPVGHNASQLSGGQRQRLAIARALYKDAPILILDEATSALDAASEQAVKQALSRLMAGRTTLVIAHRLSTIQDAHRIVVMQAGRVVESGTHAALMAAGGLYSQLARLGDTSVQ